MDILWQSTVSAARNSAFSLNFHTWKLVEISVFYAVRAQNICLFLYFSLLNILLLLLLLSALTSFLFGLKINQLMLTKNAANWSQIRELFHGFFFFYIPYPGQSKLNGNTKILILWKSLQKFYAFFMSTNLKFMASRFWFLK